MSSIQINRLLDTRLRGYDVTPFFKFVLVPTLLRGYAYHNNNRHPAT